MNPLKEKISQMLEEHPMLADFFTYKSFNDSLTLENYLNSFSEEELEELGTSREHLRENILELIKQMDKKSLMEVNSITVKGGCFKDGTPENAEVVLKKGTVISIVGPTGSGKSRLLADIEWMAQRDTPTFRQILINDEVPDSKLRFSFDYKLVAQLSQNMNFVMDTTVEEFIKMHIESRNLSNSNLLMKEIVAQANLLSGESFEESTPITSLSGGQSRALMIADTAFLSSSPIVLIDEIENAGIDRKKALELLVRKEKIILIATHDPILALLAEKRIIIKNGGIIKMIETTEKEKQNLVVLEKMDARLMELRNRLRNGEELNKFDLNNE